MKFHIWTDDIKLVYNKKGPMVRFSITMGIITDDDKNILWKTEGCLLRPDKTDEGTMSETFKWSPPLQRMGIAMKQLNHPTPVLYDLVLGCLEKQGVLVAYRKKLAEFAVSAAPGAVDIPGIKEAGTFVLE